jgi:hypothetical protein
MRIRALACAAGTTLTIGCGPVTTVTTTARLREPASIEAKYVKGWSGTDARVVHAPDGAVVIEVDGVTTDLLVSPDGEMLLAHPPGMLDQPPHARIDRYDVTFTSFVHRGAGRSLGILAEYSVTTPRANVIELRERRAPSSASPVPWLALGTVFVAASAGSIYLMASRDETGPAEKVGYVAVAALFVGLGATTLIEGIHRLVSKPKEVVLIPSGTPPNTVAQ